MPYIHTKASDHPFGIVALCSATGNRTRVYGVRGRCPRPLDDSTVTLCRTSFSKAGAKVLQKNQIRKYF